jgi:hypothetical protein
VYFYHHQPSTPTFAGQNSSLEAKILCQAKDGQFPIEDSKKKE